MRTVRIMLNVGEFSEGQIVRLEDQQATNAIANGWAVPNDAHVFGTPEAEAPPVPAPAPAAPVASIATKAAAAAKAMGAARGGSSTATSGGK